MTLIVLPTGLNVRKCNFMILCTPAKSHTFDKSNLNLTIDGKLLNIVHTQIYIGCYH